MSCKKEMQQYANTILIGCKLHPNFREAEMWKNIYSSVTKGILELMKYDNNHNTGALSLLFSSIQVFQCVLILIMQKYLIFKSEAWKYLI